MKLLFHMCCAPCSIYPVQTLKIEGYELHGFFYNPNIHPYTEYKKRMETAEEYCSRIEIPLILNDEYDIESFLRNAAFTENSRCQMCYTMRLERAASVAKANGFEGFTTSLLVSPYQKHDLIKSIGETIGQKYGIEFVYRDFRNGFREGQQKAKDMELYKQQYCGCIFSEQERYLTNKNKKDRSE